MASAVLHALRVTGLMTWQVTWSLILGFTLSAIVEALVRKSTIARLLPDDRPSSLATAAALGAASSSCSYAAVALARALFRKGADFTASMAFQFASTNLVIELGLILGLLLGWQFTLAEFVGGPLMIVLLALLFRSFLTTKLREAAREQVGLLPALLKQGGRSKSRERVPRWHLAPPPPWAKVRVANPTGNTCRDPTVGNTTINIHPLPTVTIGAIGGVIVGMTSVGSGSLIIIALMYLYPTLRASELVGTDLVQAVPLVASAAVGHLIFGDFKLGSRTRYLSVRSPARTSARSYPPAFPEH